MMSAEYIGDWLFRGVTGIAIYFLIKALSRLDQVEERQQKDSLEVKEMEHKHKIGIAELRHDNSHELAEMRQGYLQDLTEVKQENERNVFKLTETHNMQLSKIDSQLTGYSKDISYVKTNLDTLGTKFFKEMKDYHAKAEQREERTNQIIQDLSKTVHSLDKTVAVMVQQNK